MGKDMANDKTFAEPELTEAPAGVDRRAFLMRSATIGAAAVLTGCSTEEKTKQVGGTHPLQRRPLLPRLRPPCHPTWKWSRNRRGQ
jgi:hypothetical protein